MYGREREKRMWMRMMGNDKTRQGGYGIVASIRSSGSRDVLCSSIAL